MPSLGFSNHHISFLLLWLLLAFVSISPLQETEEPVVECQECEMEASPSQTGGSSGDLGDVSSFSSKASSLQRTSSGASLSAVHSSGGSGRGAGALKGRTGGTEPADFALPSSRGGPGKLRCRQGLQRASHSRGRVADLLLSQEKGSNGKSCHPPSRINQLLFFPFCSSPVLGLHGK